MTYSKANDVDELRKFSVSFLMLLDYLGFEPEDIIDGVAEGLTEYHHQLKDG
jgi:hypothetical protein